MSVTRPTVVALVVALLTAIMVVSTGGPAAAAKCVAGEMRLVDGKLTYVCTQYEGGGTTPGGGGTGSGPAEPACDLQAPYDELCIGTAACWMNDPAAVQDPKELEGTPKPNPDSHVVYVSCKGADGSLYDEWYWNDDLPTVTLEDRIIAALGALDLPTIQASFNPETRTLVNLPTWWWAEGAPAGEIEGSAALGLRAYAAPRGLSVVPGDGSSTVACPMSVERSDTCTTTYVRAGDYTATVSIVYDIRFMLGGTELDAGDVPARFRSITVDDDVAVAVREVQTRVTKVR